MTVPGIRRTGLSSGSDSGCSCVHQFNRHGLAAPAKQARASEWKGMVDIKIAKPPVPLIWLDTWMFNNFGRMRAGILPPEQSPDFRALFDLLLELRDKVAVICPETGQFVEIHPVGWSIEHAKSALSMVSGGVKTHHEHVMDTQLYRAMQAYAHRWDAFELTYREAFTEDPIRELSERDILMRVDMMPPAKELAATRATNARIAASMEELRLELVQSKMTLAKQIEQELDADRYMAKELIRRVLAPMSSGKEPSSPDDLLSYAMIVARPARQLGDLLETAGRERGGDVDELFAFYQSDYHREHPGPRIRAELFARKMVGGERIEPGDVMDIKQISAFLPFATHIILDKSMATRVEEAKLDQRYGVKLFKRKDLPRLIVELQALAASAPSRAIPVTV